MTMIEPPLRPPPSPFGDDNPLAAPLGVGDVLDGAFRLYRAHFGPMLFSAAIVMVPLGIMAAQMLGPTQAAQLGVFQTMLRQREAFDASALDAAAPFPILAMCLLVPLQVLGTLLTRLVLTQQAVDAFKGRARSVGERFRIASARLPSYAAMGCLVWLLIGIVVIGLGLAGAVAMGAVGVFAAAGAGSGATVLAAVLVGAAVLAMFVGIGGAALYLSGRWVAALPTLVLVTPDPIAALGTSWQLTARRPWRAMGFTVLLLLLNYALTAILTTPLYFASVLMPPSTATALGMGIQALGAVVAILIQPLSTAAVVVFHYDLRLRAERAP
ncbi:MAG: glycerophosphoryl diester phosphodiesterase membrane domain-containing protein [Ardenticatenales bacterium]|nr:glycerophosphoryl diester phosphodiesterase membrane domain-containing protein [Ardenticatenales bacterium]